MATTSLPGPSERRAPRFDGDGRTLLQFIDHYETVATDAGLQDKERILKVTTYMTAEPRDLVEGYAEYRDAAKTKWTDFVKRLKLDYYDCEKPKEYKRADYDAYKAKALNLKIKDVKTLVEFTREFRRLSADVIRSEEISAKQAQRHYYAILVKVLGQTLESRLTASDATKRPSDWTYEEVMTKAKEVIEDLEIEDRDFRQGATSNTASSATLPSAYSQPQTKIKLETEDRLASLLTKLNTRIDQIEDVVRKSTATGTAATPRQNQTNQASDQRFGSPGYRCYWDGCSRRLPDCEKLKIDLEQGFAKRIDGRVVYPDGSAIYGGPGVLLRERVAEWHKNHPEAKKSSGSMAAMLVDIGDGFFSGVKPPRIVVHPSETGAKTVQVPVFATQQAEADWYAAMYDGVFAQEQQRALEDQPVRRYPLRGNRGAALPKAAAPAPTIDREKPPHFDAKIDKIPPKTKEAAPAGTGGSSGTDGTPRRAVPPATIEEVTDDDEPHPPMRTQAAPARAFDPVPVAARPLLPAYKIQAPVESEGLVKIINDRILEGRVALTVQELLSICPALRRHFRDQASGRRVVVGLADEDSARINEVMLFRSARPDEREDSRDLIVADFAAPLRYLDCRVGNFIVEGVIDNGSQLVVMSQKFWEAARQPLDNRYQTNMTAANGTRASTMGVCVNFPVIIAGITFYVQAHVVEEAPFSLLLGRPFLVLAAAIEATRTDGSSIITLHDPNSNGRHATVATRARSAEGQHADF